jgi:hypothetical protein
VESIEAGRISKPLCGPETCEEIDAAGEGRIEYD